MEPFAPWVIATTRLPSRSRAIGSRQDEVLAGLAALPSEVLFDLVVELIDGSPPEPMWTALRIPQSVLPKLVALVEPHRDALAARLAAWRARLLRDAAHVSPIEAQLALDPVAPLVGAWDAALPAIRRASMSRRLELKRSCWFMLSSLCELVFDLEVQPHGREEPGRAEVAGDGRPWVVAPWIGCHVAGHHASWYAQGYRGPRAHPLPGPDLTAHRKTPVAIT